MAKMRCRCGNQIRDDDPDHSLVMNTHRAFEELDFDGTALFGRGVDMLRCVECGRLWVFWDEHGSPTEYRPVPRD
ncbi:hypothetical protein [Streptomyces sp. NPDC003090]|uniref:hypothetical protein n=1 Tax=Streptomyces sp. NPDC003090 TaxID=3154274 RepID=UPI00380DA33D